MIQRILTILLLLTVALPADSTWLRSYSEAQVQALNEKKNIMVMLSQEGCDACWYMENVVFDDAKIKALILENFIPVYLDINDDEIPDMFKHRGTPTFYFTKPNGEKIGHQISGACNIKDFSQTLDEVLNKLKK